MKMVEDAGAYLLTVGLTADLEKSSLKPLERSPLMTDLQSGCTYHEGGANGSSTGPCVPIIGSSWVFTTAAGRGAEDAH